MNRMRRHAESPTDFTDTHGFEIPGIRVNPCDPWSNESALSGFLNEQLNLK